MRHLSLELFATRLGVRIFFDGKQDRSIRCGNIGEMLTELLRFGEGVGLELKSLKDFCDIAGKGLKEFFISKLLNTIHIQYVIKY